MSHVRERSSDDRADREKTAGPVRQAAAPERAMAASGGAVLDGIGNRALLALMRSGRLRRKPRVSQPDDPLEREADRTADRVLRVSTAPTEDDAVSRRPLAPPAAADLGTVPPVLETILRAPGEPLDEASRSFFEPRFAQDLSRVRIHTGERAVAAAESVAARAFTVGPHIVFGADAHRPETAEGRTLLAHELAHVVQQSGQVPLIQRAPANYPGNNPLPTQTSQPVVPSGSKSPPPLSDDDWIGILEALRFQAPQEFLKILVSREAFFYQILSPYGFQGSWVKDEAYLDDFDKAVRKWGKSSIYRHRIAELATALVKPKPKSREEQQYENAQYLVIDMNRQGYSRRQVNSAIESVGLMAELEAHGFEKVGRWSFKNSEAYKWSAVDALNQFIGRYQSAHDIVVPMTASVPTPDPAEYYRVWLEGLNYVTSSLVAAEFAGLAMKFTDDPRVITGAAGLGAAFEGAVGATAVPLGNRGSYVPEVENKPARVIVQDVRYGGKQPLKPPVDPTKLGGPPVAARLADAQAQALMRELEQIQSGAAPNALPPGPQPRGPLIVDLQGGPMISERGPSFLVSQVRQSPGARGIAIEPGDYVLAYQNIMPANQRDLNFSRMLVQNMPEWPSGQGLVLDWLEWRFNPEARFPKSGDVVVLQGTPAPGRTPVPEAFFPPVSKSGAVLPENLRDVGGLTPTTHPVLHGQVDQMFWRRPFGLGRADAATIGSLGREFDSMLKPGGFVEFRVLPSSDASAALKIAETMPGARVVEVPQSAIKSYAESLNAGAPARPAGLSDEQWSILAAAAPDLQGRHGALGQGVFNRIVRIYKPGSR